MSYFEQSQRLKVDVLQSPGIVDKIRGFYLGTQELEWIASGIHNHLWQVGQTNSGLWVALRCIDDQIAYDTPILGMLLYETYCKEAERYFNKGKRVPISLGAYIAVKSMPFLLVEDLTEGFQYRVCGRGDGDNPGYIEKEGKRIPVRFDLGKDSTLGMRVEEDAIFEGRFDEGSLKYFHPEARLNI